MKLLHEHDKNVDVKSFIERALAVSEEEQGFDLPGGADLARTEGSVPATGFTQTHRRPA